MGESSLGFREVLSCSHLDTFETAFSKHHWAGDDQLLTGLRTELLPRGLSSTTRIDKSPKEYVPSPPSIISNVRSATNKDRGLVRLVVLDLRV